MDHRQMSFKVAVMGAVFATLGAVPVDVHAASAFVCTTQTHRIEIDAVGGGEQYEYRSWRLNKPGDGPALTLRGSLDVQGTGACRTRYWTFKNGKYEYVIADSANCGEKMPPASATGQLTVSLSGKEISQSWCFGERGSHAQSVGNTPDDSKNERRNARGRAEDERFAVNIEEMKRGAQALIDLETKYPWSSRIADTMARGTTKNHCMPVLRAVAAYEKNRLPVPPDLVVGARNTGCL